MQYEPQDPMIAMDFAQRALTLESFSITAAAGSVSQFFGGLIAGLKFQRENTQFDSVDDETYKLLMSQKAKHLKFIEALPLESYKGFHLQIPAGLIGYWLPYIEAVQEEAQRLQSIHTELINPFVTYLAQVISDKNASISTNTLMIARAEKTQKEREKSMVALGKYFNGNQVTTRAANTIIKDDADWGKVYAALEKLQATKCSVKLGTLVDATSSAEQYIKTIIDGVQNAEIEISPQQKGCLSSMCYQVARELEAHALMRYRVHAIVGAVSASITKMQLKLAK